jgi:hypothetical protein
MEEKGDGQREQASEDSKQRVERRRRRRWRWLMMMSLWRA